MVTRAQILAAGFNPLAEKPNFVFSIFHRDDIIIVFDGTDVFRIRDDPSVFQEPFSVLTALEMSDVFDVLTRALTLLPTVRDAILLRVRRIVPRMQVVDPSTLGIGR